MDYSKVSVTVRRSDGKEFNIDNTNWRILSDGLDGFDYVDQSIVTEANAFGDGSRVMSVRTPEIDRTVTCVYNGSLENKAHQRQTVRKFFNRAYDYDIILEYMGEKKYCEGKLYSLTLPTENIYEFMTLTFTILSVQPYLLSYDDFGKNIAMISGGLEFNFEIPEDGIEFGTYSFAKEVQIDNEGDVDTYCKAIFTAKGSVTNPKLIKDDKYVRIIDTMVSGDEIVIDLVSKPVSITKNGVNIIGKTDRTSSFNGMVLSVGSNTIAYDADNGDNMLDVTIYYNERFTGI